MMARTTRPARIGPARIGPARIGPARIGTTRIEPARIEPARIEPARIGTAGWAIPRADAERFAGSGSHLERYAAQFTAAEINSSFHRPHRPQTYARWAASVPADFRFSVKLPRAVSHDRRLVGIDDLLARFADEVAGLGDRLGVLLAQLPPSLAFDAAVARAFFTAAAALPATLACEPRHPSWFAPDADALLADLRVARVAADPSPAPGADRPGGWMGLAYHRLHGSPRTYYSAYDDAAIAGIATAIEGAASTERWCIFDNTASGAATGNALALQARLDGRGAA